MGGSGGSSNEGEGGPWGKIPLSCDDATLIDQFMDVQGLMVYTDSERVLSLMPVEVRS